MTITDHSYKEGPIFMKKKLIILMLLIMCAFTACSQASKTDDKAGQETEETEEDEDEDEESSSKKKDKKKDKEKEKSADYTEQFKQIEGNWQYVSRKYFYGEYGDKLADMEMDFYTTEDDYLYGNAEFYEENGEWYADLTESEYEYYGEYYHYPARVVMTPLYEGCENQKWHVIVENPRKKEKVFEATLIGENKLEIYKESGEEPDEEGYSWRSADIVALYREGSPELDNVTELYYEKTVTVSNKEELVKAVDNNTKIILKAGDYDFTHDIGDFDNPKVMWDNGSVCISNVSYLKFEAGEGKDAEITIDDPYSAVLRFDGCNRIAFDGVTMGHRVEPGTCGAPVIEMRNSYNMDVNNCHLYGCGSYGLEAYDCSSIHFDNTEIYECTYGIMTGYNSYNMIFKNCDMHDNSMYTQIELYNSANVSFENCTFSNNTVSEMYYNEGKFVHTDEDCYSVAFKDCEFKGNIYQKFADESVEVENCTFDDDVRPND